MISTVTPGWFWVLYLVLLLSAVACAWWR